MKCENIEIKEQFNLFSFFFVLELENSFNQGPTICQHHYIIFIFSLQSP